MEYFTFPMETLNVTQNYLGTGSHYPHTTGIPKDYPIDIAGVDGGQSAVFARVPLKVVAKKGISNTTVTNTVWLETVDKVITPTFTDNAWMTLTHWNDGDTAMQKWDVGTIIPSGSIICYEGKDGATSNHIHMVCGRGACSGWVESTTGKWVMNGESLPPEQVLYIDPSFTTAIKNRGDLSWIEIPNYIGTPVARDTTKNQIGVLVEKLNVREDHTSGSVSFGYINLGIYDYTEVYEDGTYTWYKTTYGWIATNGSWLNVYPKEESGTPSEPDDCGKRVEELENQLNSLQKQVESLQMSLTEKDQTIASLQEQIAALENQTNEWNLLSSFKASKTGYYYLKLVQDETLLFQVINEKA